MFTVSTFHPPHQFVDVYSPHTYTIAMSSFCCCTTHVLLGELTDVCYVLGGAFQASRSKVLQHSCIPTTERPISMCIYLFIMICKRVFESVCIENEHWDVKVDGGGHGPCMCYQQCRDVNAIHLSHGPCCTHHFWQWQRNRGSNARWYLPMMRASSRLEGGCGDVDGMSRR